MDEYIKNVTDIDYQKLLHKDIGNNIYLTSEQIEILEDNQVPYSKCKDIHELIYLLEQYNDSDEIESILQEVAEFNYYHNTKK